MIAKNLIVHNIYEKDPWFWIDKPSQEKGYDLRIEKYIAWQTHCVKKQLEE